MNRQIIKTNDKTNEVIKKANIYRQDKLGDHEY